ncbi:MAG: hypothetical protein FWG73_02765 [Planctomycetaceae bacterium]|nr:hypothetical protein [Planctomycetaceae bacterium]
MNTIEHKLSALKPVGQPELARRILDTHHRRRQRRRDCFVAFAGLLTGIAATLVVVLSLPGKVVEVSSVQYVFINEQPNDRAGHASASRNPDASTPSVPLDFGVRRNDDMNPDSIDIEAWIARYERLFRHRRETASRFVVIPQKPPILPEGVSLWEYRQSLLEKLQV